VNLTLSDNTHSVENAESRIAPEAIALDQALLDRPQSAEIQLDLFGDYKSNVALYPRFQEYFRTYRRPTLAVWGKNDPANGSSKQTASLLAKMSSTIDPAQDPKVEMKCSTPGGQPLANVFHGISHGPKRARIGEERRSFSNRIHRS
jgi:hypothetical protein